MPSTIQRPSSLVLWYALMAGVLLYVCLHVLARVSTLALDDTFIYFNYAKHVADGNGIVFDPRGIPSEGVTSLLFLFLLVPWELAEANPMTGAVLYNALACLGCGLVLGHVARTHKLLNLWLAPVATLLFLLACCFDKSIRLVTFRGLETMLGPLGITLCAAMVAAALHKQDRFERGVFGFMALAFITYLIRPEYIVYLAAVGLVLLFRPSRIPRLWRPGLLLAGLLVGLFIWKWQTFSSLMPTAYYRKVAGAERNGPAYVLQWLQAYWPLLAATLACLVAERRLIKSPFVQSLCIASLVNVLLVLRMLVLVGYGYRFLILPITVCYLLLALSVCSLLQRLPTMKPQLAVGLAAAAFVAANLIKPLPLGYPQAWNLESRADQSFAENEYFQFARHLKKALPDPAAFTLSFGDAGTLPYALGCRYVDPNGLSEPEIAHLFQEDDSPAKARKFVELIFQHQPDMIIPPMGATNDQGIHHPAKNAHDPFQGTLPAAYWQQLVKDGYVHICTLDLHYPVEVTLRKDSPLYPALLQNVLAFAQDGHGRISDRPRRIAVDGQIIEVPSFQ